MKKAILASFVLICAVLTWFIAPKYFKPKTVSLSGQIFIVTKSGESVKLGLIDVMLIERTNAAQSLNAIAQTIKGESQRRQVALEAAKKDLVQATNAWLEFDNFGPLHQPTYLAIMEKLNPLSASLKAFDQKWEESNAADKQHVKDAMQADEELRTSTKPIDVLEREYAPWDSVGRVLEALNTQREHLLEYKTEMTNTAPQRDEQLSLALEAAKILLPAMTNRDSLLTALATTRTNLELAEIAQKTFPTADDWFAGFSPNIFLKATTDADGKFSLAYPDEIPFVLLAKAQRTIGTETEEYFWLINAPTNSETPTVFLSNNNLVYDDPDGFFKIKPKRDP